MTFEETQRIFTRRGLFSGLFLIAHWIAPKVQYLLIRLVLSFGLRVDVRTVCLWYFPTRLSTRKKYETVCRLDRPIFFRVPPRPNKFFNLSSVLTSLLLPTTTSTMSSSNEASSSSYTVLYYKRKVSKVHKSKGVSKLDGTLVIYPPPKATVTLKDGNDNVVFRGSNVDIAKRAGDLQQDEIVSVGNFEVEICDRMGGTQMVATAVKKNGSVASTASKAGSSTISQPFRRPLIGRRTCLPTESISRSNLNASQNRIPPSRVQPPQPIRKVASSDDDSDSDCNDIKPSAMKENAQNLPLKRKNLPLKSVRSLKVQKARKLATTAAGDTLTASNIFVDAIGDTPDVPHSIKSVLKPHQITGVSFLWNCLTGNGKAATASPHVSDDHVFKGAILADGRHIETRHWFFTIFEHYHLTIRFVVCLSRNGTGQDTHDYCSSVCLAPTKARSTICGCMPFVSSYQLGQ